MFTYCGNKRKNAFFFFLRIFFVNKIFSKFIACMWTARCTILKNTKKVYIFEETEFLGFSQKWSISENWPQILKIVQSLQLRQKRMLF